MLLVCVICTNTSVYPMYVISHTNRHSNIEIGKSLCLFVSLVSSAYSESRNEFPSS